MDNIIDKILATDKKASEILVKVEHARERIIAETASEKQKLITEAEKRLEEKLSDVKHSADRELDVRLAVLDDELAEKKKAMAASFADYSDKHRDEIINRVLNGEV